jgi:hypothetical protein
MPESRTVSGSVDALLPSPSDNTSFGSADGAEPATSLQDLCDALDSLFEGDRDFALTWLAQNLAITDSAGREKLAKLGRLMLWNFKSDLAGPNGRDPEIGSREIEIDDLVNDLYHAAENVSFAPAILTIYIKLLCEAAWEVSWWHPPFIRAIEAASRFFKAPRRAPDPLTAAALSCLIILERELEVETAIATGSPALTAKRCWLAANAANDAVGSVLKALPVPSTDSPAQKILTYVQDCGEREGIYYGAVAEAAEALDGCFTDPPDRLDQAIRRLRGAEANHRLIDEIDRSELRAHRATLDALTMVRDQEWLQVDHGTVVYIYPFGLRGKGKESVPPKDILAAFKKTAKRPWTLAGMQVTEVTDELLLNDIWRGNDPHKRQYSGAAAMLPDLEMPDLMLADPKAGEKLVLSVELRLCDLGNNYLKITMTLDGATPHGLHAATLRPAPESGDLSELELDITVKRNDESAPTLTDLSDEGQDGSTNGRTSAGWGRLADFSDAVIGDVARRLTADMGKDIEHSGRPGLYHVLVSIQRASARRRDAEPRVLNHGCELRNLLGIQSGWHPVRHGVSAIGEWVRYPIDLSLTVASPAFTGDLLVRTANTTLIGIVGSPDHMIEAVSEAAEFVATLEGLFGAWQQELAAYYRSIQKLLTRTIAILEPPDVIAEQEPEELEEPAGTEHDESDSAKFQQLLLELEGEQLRLHHFVMASRRTLMFITSPSLVTSPVMRVTLDQLLDAAGFGRLRSEFEGMVNEVLGDRLGTLVDTSVRRRQELHAEHEEKRATAQRKRTDIILAAIAGVGTAGVFQVLQAGFDQNIMLSIAFAVLTVVLAVIIALIYASYAKTTDEKDHQ